MSGWWRLFVVLSVLWALIAGAYVLDASKTQVDAVIQFEAGFFNSVCDRKGASSKQCSDARVAALSDKAIDVGPAWIWLLFWLVSWSVPLLIVLGAVWISRWVMRGFPR